MIYTTSGLDFHPQNDLTFSCQFLISSLPSHHLSKSWPEVRSNKGVRAPISFFLVSSVWVFLSPSIIHQKPAPPFSSQLPTGEMKRYHCFLLRIFRPRIPQNSKSFERWDSRTYTGTPRYLYRRGKTSAHRNDEKRYRFFQIGFQTGSTLTSQDSHKQVQSEALPLRILWSAFVFGWYINDSERAKLAYKRK